MWTVEQKIRYEQQCGTDHEGLQPMRRHCRLCCVVCLLSTVGAGAHRVVITWLAGYRLILQEPCACSGPNALEKKTGAWMLSGCVRIWVSYSTVCLTGMCHSVLHFQSPMCSTQVPSQTLICHKQNWHLCSIQIHLLYRNKMQMYFGPDWNILTRTGFCMEIHSPQRINPNLVM